MLVINGLTLVNKEIYGVHRYTFEIVKELDKLVNKNEVVLVVPTNGDRELSFNNIEVIKTGKITSKNPLIKKLQKDYWNDVVFKKVVRKNKAVSFDATLNFPRFGCDIVVVHDCIPNLFPEHYTSKKDRLFRKMLLSRQKKAIRKCSSLVTVSGSAKNDLIKIYKINPEKITIIGNAWQHFNNVEEDKDILNKLGLEDGKYFFSLGSRAPTKNTQWILKAAEQNPEELFVISGSSNVFSSYSDKTNNDRKNVIFTGYLSDGEVKALMHHCKAFIQPSLYEGFGIPPMEAMSVGTKCIVSNASSLPEIYQKSVWYIDPNQYENIDLNAIMKEPVENNSLVLNQYSWEKSAKKIKEIYESISSKKI